MLLKFLILLCCGLTVLQPLILIMSLSEAMVHVPALLQVNDMTTAPDSDPVPLQVDHSAKVSETDQALMTVMTPPT